MERPTLFAHPNRKVSACGAGSHPGDWAAALQAPTHEQHPQGHPGGSPLEQPPGGPPDVQHGAPHLDHQQQVRTTAPLLLFLRAEQPSCRRQFIDARIVRVQTGCVPTTTFLRCFQQLCSDVVIQAEPVHFNERTCCVTRLRVAWVG